MVYSITNQETTITMRTILTLALLMTSTLIFGATLDTDSNSNSNSNINYMETLALEAEATPLVIEERNSLDAVAKEGDKSASKIKEVKKINDNQAGSQTPNQDYEILKRSQRILEVKYKLYA